MMFSELVDSKSEGKTTSKIGTRFTRLYYIAFNMHWEERIFSMPNLIKKAKWNELLTTGDSAVLKEANGSTSFAVPPRTVVIFEAK